MGGGTASFGVGLVWRSIASVCVGPRALCRAGQAGAAPTRAASGAPTSAACSQHAAALLRDRRMRPHPAPQTHACTLPTVLWGPGDSASGWAGATKLQHETFTEGARRLPQSTTSSSAIAITKSVVGGCRRQLLQAVASAKHPLCSVAPLLPRHPIAPAVAARWGSVHASMRHTPHTPHTPHGRQRACSRRSTSSWS